MRRYRWRSGSSSGDGLAALIIGLMILISAIPIAGLYLLFAGRTPAIKIIGGIVLVIGICVWFYIGSIN